MGLISNQFRLLYLTIRKNDLEYKLQLFSEAKIRHLSTSQDLVSVGTDLDPSSPEVRLLESRRERLNLIDKQLDVQIEQFKAQLGAVENEIQAVEKLRDKNVQSFNYAKGGQ